MPPSNRFEYASEAVWKAGQVYLPQHEGLDLGSPRGAIRAFLHIHQFKESEAQLTMNMIDDQNLAVHTYLMDKWIEMMKG